MRTLGMLALVGCTGVDVEASCDAYVAAWSACIDEAYAEDPGTRDAALASSEGQCTAFADVRGASAKTAAEVLDCQASTISGGDCATPEAAAATVASATSCGG